MIDPSDGLNAEELAMALGLADEMRQQEREEREMLQEQEPLIPDPDAPQWYEKD